MENHMRGIKILDFSQALAGPYCTLMLGDAGADIIKVERPGSGDMSRSWGAEFTPGMNSYFASINRNKKCMTVRMDSDKGRDIIHRLAAWADVVVENYRPGVTQKLQMDYDTLSKINPKLIYCSITGFGAVGPDAKRPGFDLIAQGMGGIMGFTGQKGRHAHQGGRGHRRHHRRHVRRLRRDAGPVGTGAQRRRPAGADLVAGRADGPADLSGRRLFHHRRIAPARRKHSPHDRPLRDLFPPRTATSISRRATTRCGASSARNWTWSTWKRIRVLTPTPSGWKTVRRSIELLEAETAKYGKDELLEKLAKARIPVGPVNTLEELFGSEQVKALETVREVVHEKLGAMKVVASPLNYSKTPDEIRTPPSVLGEHTDEILSGVLNLSEAEIAALKEQSII